MNCNYVRFIWIFYYNNKLILLFSKLDESLLILFLSGTGFECFCPMRVHRIESSQQNMYDCFDIRYHIFPICILQYKIC
jgi:hypothetical protein